LFSGQEGQSLATVFRVHHKSERLPHVAREEGKAHAAGTHVES